MSRNYSGNSSENIRGWLVTLTIPGAAARHASEREGFVRMCVQPLSSCDLNIPTGEEFLKNFQPCSAGAAAYVKPQNEEIEVFAKTMKNANVFGVREAAGPQKGGQK